MPRLKPNYTTSDWVSVFNIFQSDALEQYEQAFSKKFDNKYGVMFQHGRTALYALFKIWGLKEDEIICPAYTCVVVANAIVLSGNTPVFVDCARDSFNMDLSLLESSITNKTRAIVVTHLFGYPMNVIQIEKIVKKYQQRYGHKIYVIQDVAHSYGARWNNQLVTRFGDAAIFGSNISKLINSIFGGMAITNSYDTYTKLMRWRNKNLKKIRFKEIKRLCYFVAVNLVFNSYVYKITNWLERQGFLDYFVRYYDEGKIEFPNDWNCFPSNLEARVGMSQIKKYDSIVECRIKNSINWIQKHQTSDIIFHPSVPGTTFSHCVGLVKNREKWLDKYRSKGVQLGILIEYSIPYMKSFSKYRRGDYLISLAYSKKTINFPNWF